jgi:hypothetical protein
MSTRKNTVDLLPIPPEDLLLLQHYTAIHYTDSKKDIEGCYLGIHNGHPVFDTEKNVVETPVKDYVFYPFSINRKMLKRFGIDISSFNRTYPARNTPAFKAVPNFGFFTKQRQRSRKRGRRG